MNRPLIHILLLLMPGLHTAYGQERTVRQVDIIRADSGSGEVVNGEAVRNLIGNVRLRQDSTLLSADRAVQYVDRNEIVFDGSVQIIDRGDSLSARHVFYDTRTKTGKAEGQVRLSDGDVIVFAPSGRYFVDEKRGRFEEGLTLVDSATTVVSRQGEYWSEEKRAEFEGDVRLDQDRTRLEADSVTYFRETEVSLARGNVFIERIGDDDEGDPDSSRVTMLFGGKAYNDNRARYSKVEERPLLVRVETDSTGATDTLLVRSVTLESSKQDSLQRLVATDSVRIWKGDMASLSDSLVYDRITLNDEVDREEIRLFRNPSLWHRDSQVTGDTVRVTLREGRIDSLLVSGNAFVAQQDTALIDPKIGTGRIRQLAGAGMVGLFEQDSLRTLIVEPDVELIHYMAEDDGTPNGAVRSAGDRGVFRFRSDRLDRVTIETGVQATYYPEGKIPESFELPGYRWEPDRRPTRSALTENETLLRRLNAEEPPVASGNPPDEPG